MKHKYRPRRTHFIARPNVTLDEARKALNYGLVRRDGVPAIPEDGEPSTLKVKQRRRLGPLRWHVRAHVKIVPNSAMDTKFEVTPGGRVKFLSCFFVDEICELLDELAAGHGPTQTEGYSPDTLTSLLGVYATQFGSYTTLLWQVPALGLTAQAFLMTIALGYRSSTTARLIASLLSSFIACASFALMHHQRGRAINHGGLAKKLSEKLELAQLLGRLEIDDAQPKTTNAERVWTVDHTIYLVWRVLMVSFILADIAVFISLGLHLNWFK